MSEVDYILAEFDEATNNVLKIATKVKTLRKPTEQWKLFVKALVYMTRAHNKFVTSDKKKTFTYLINQLAKSNVFINIKNTKFRNEVERLSNENAKDAEIDKFASENEALIEQLTIPKTYNPRNMDIYNKIGYYIFHNWKYAKPIPKLNKTIRIAVGMTVIKYIDNQLEAIKSNKKTGKIAIKF